MLFGSFRSGAALGEDDDYGDRPWPARDPSFRTSIGDLRSDLRSQIWRCRPDPPGRVGTHKYVSAANIGAGKLRAWSVHARATFQLMKLRAGHGPPPYTRHPSGSSPRQSRSVFEHRSLLGGLVATAQRSLTSSIPKLAPWAGNVWPEGGVSDCCLFV